MDGLHNNRLLVSMKTKEKCSIMQSSIEKTFRLDWTGLLFDALSFGKIHRTIFSMITRYWVYIGNLDKQDDPLTFHMSTIWNEWNIFRMECFSSIFYAAN